MVKTASHGPARPAPPKCQKVKKRPAGRTTSSKCKLLPAQPETVELLNVPRPSSIAKVTLASDCSGLCTEGPAVRVNLPPAVSVEHVYASEIDPKFRPMGSSRMVSSRFPFLANYHHPEGNSFSNL